MRTLLVGLSLAALLALALPLVEFRPCGIEPCDAAQRARPSSVHVEAASMQSSSCSSRSTRDSAPGSCPGRPSGASGKGRGTRALQARVLGFGLTPASWTGEGSHPRTSGTAAILGANRSAQSEASTSTGNLLLGVGLLGLAALGMVILFRVRRAASAAQKRDGTPGTRSEDLDDPDNQPHQEGSEPSPLTEEESALLLRVKEELQQERSFSSYVAHELRTPLTGLRLALEALLVGSRTSSEYQEGLEACLKTTKNMQALVRKLLDVARADHSMLEPVETDLHALFEEVCDGVRAQVRARRLSVDIEDHGAGAIRVDRGLLERVAVNLIENAVAYSDEGGAIDVEFRAVGAEHIEMRITNPSKGTLPGDGERVFETLWRREGLPARDDHCGLGLSLTRRIVFLLGGRIEARTEVGRFTISVELPRESD